MCFSATASFVAAGLLSFIGARSINLASQKQKAYASIPLIFALQQTAEGLIWITIDTSPNVALILARIFLFFALVCWPIWMPFAVGSLEADPKRSYLLKGYGIVGYIYGIAAAVLIFCFPVEVHIVGHSIAYQLALTGWAQTAALGTFLLVAVTPWFVSSHHLFNLFGALALATMGITYYVWATTFTSVWCFFAALLSVMVWLSLELNWIGAKSTIN